MEYRLVLVRSTSAHTSYAPRRFRPITRSAASARERRPSPLPPRSSTETATCTGESPDGFHSKAADDPTCPRSPRSAPPDHPCDRTPHPPAARPGQSLQPPPSSAGESSPSKDWALTRSEEHTCELQSLIRTSYAVFCLKKKHTTISLSHQHI